jgi:hypothetical protein
MSGTTNTKKGRLHLTVLPQVWPAVRPADCEDGSEPCPLPGECKYHIDNPAHPEVTCAIDVAEDGGEPITLRELGRLLGVSNEMVYKIQRRAMRKVAAVGVRRFWDGEG